jgi:hypothetical protein
MSAFRLIGVVVVLSTAIATPVPAQQVISEPGYCAQFYPYANCQNKGPNNPYTGSYQRGLVQNDGMWSGDQTVGVAKKRPRAHRSDSMRMQ